MLISGAISRILVVEICNCISSFDVYSASFLFLTQLQELKRKSSMEAELRCLRAVGTMEEKLRNACNAPDATYESVIKVCTRFFSLVFVFVRKFYVHYGLICHIRSNCHFVAKGIEGMLSFCRAWTVW